MWAGLRPTLSLGHSDVAWRPEGSFTTDRQGNSLLSLDSVPDSLLGAAHTLFQWFSK